MELFILCIKIFFVRIIDVSLGTVRTVLTVKDKSVLASLIGFIEVLIWFMIVKDALNNESNSFVVAIFYALGFACGTYVGGLLAKVFSNKSVVTVQIVIRKINEKVIDILYTQGYALTRLEVSGYHDENLILLFIETNNNQIKKLKSIVKQYDKNAFIVISDTKAVYNGYFSEKYK